MRVGGWKGKLRIFRVQYGRVEGRALTPSCKSTGITTNCWTIIDRKTLKLTKKDTPHPKTKEKPQWDGRRGAITIKSNTITAEWMTHKLENNYTTEVHTLEWSFWAPHQTSQPGVQQREEEFPENQTLKASKLWLQDFNNTGRNRDSTLGGYTQSPLCIRTQGEGAVIPQETEGDLPACVGGSPAEVGLAVAHHGDKDTGSRSSGKYSLAWALLESTISPTKEPVASTAGSPQAKQPTRREHSPTY